MGYIATQFQITNKFKKALDAVTFIKFRDMLLMSAWTLNLEVKKSKESEEKKRQNKFIVMHF